MKTAKISAICNVLICQKVMPVSSNLYKAAIQGINSISWHLFCISLSKKSLNGNHYDENNFFISR